MPEGQLGSMLRLAFLQSPVSTSGLFQTTWVCIPTSEIFLNLILVAKYNDFHIHEHLTLVVIT